MALSRRVASQDAPKPLDHTVLHEEAWRFSTEDVLAALGVVMDLETHHPTISVGGDVTTVKMIQNKAA
jgi:hypothetical protein